jgi:hypothetical protein
MKKEIFDFEVFGDREGGGGGGGADGGADGKGRRGEEDVTRNRNMIYLDVVFTLALLL